MISTREARPQPQPRHLGTEIKEGVHLVLAHPVLRAFTVYNTWTILFWSMRISAGARDWGSV